MGHVAVEKQTRCGWSHQRPRANQRVVALHQPIDSPDVRTAHTRDTLYVSCCSNFHAARSPHPHCCIVLSPVNRALANRRPQTARPTATFVPSRFSSSNIAPPRVQTNAHTPHTTLRA
jgi:hypothetical protein